MANRFHINPATGTPGPCSAQAGNCPFGGEENHYESVEAARAGFEAQQAQELFSVVMKKGPTDAPRKVHVFDERLAAGLDNAQAEFNNVDNFNDWIGGKVSTFEAASVAALHSLPGSPERKEALQTRLDAREALLAADLVAWRSSPFYDEEVEGRMKENTVIAMDADKALETSLEDSAGIAAVASSQGISSRDVENILEVAQGDYLKARSGLGSPLKQLAENGEYAQATAYVFRVQPEAVEAVLAFAATNSTVESTKPSRSLADL